VIASAAQKAAKATKTVTLYNPYEGYRGGRQLGETVDEFLERLPPQTTTTQLVDWIYIANPYRKAPKRTDEQMAKEGPLEEESDWAEFVRRGGELLEELTRRRHSVEKQMSEKSKASVSRAFNQLGYREETVKKILDTAAKLHCTNGKV
jgi:hypothetical protein